MCNRELKNPPPAYTEDGRFSRVTTSIHIFLTENTSAGTSYPAAITGGSCRSLTFRLGAPLRSHLPFTLSLPSQPPGILCNDSRACTLFVTVFLFMTIVYRSTYVCICKVCKFYFFRYFFTSSAERFSTSSSGKSSFVSSSLAISNSPISVSKWASLSITTGT